MFANVSFAAIQAAIRPTLRALSIYKMREGVTTPSFLSALQHVPLLETLILIDACPYVLSPAQKLLEPRKVVTLPCLRWVQIVSIGSTLVNLLKYLSFTAITAVHLRLRELHSLEETTPENLGEFFASKFTSNPRRMALNDTKSTLNLTTWTESGTSSSIRIASSDSLRINIIIGSMTSGLITANLFNLYVCITLTHHMVLLDAGIYEAMFAKAHNLQYLRLSSIDRVPSILRGHQEGDSGGSERLSLPSLLNLTVDKIQETDASILVEILKNRKEWGDGRKYISSLSGTWPLLDLQDN
ncbi:hypothetical protein QCA50_006113 [Cerrena zonata]|uniref:Uncharacterized protein n=1 Tax=Cerrena zonata TaxID=2478898 RepID=A0AAW0GIH1_9APHY